MRSFPTPTAGTSADMARPGSRSGSSRAGPENPLDRPRARRVTSTREPGRRAGPMPAAEDRRDFAQEVVVRLRRAGFQALWAGGCVRDILLGLTPADYDVATSATPEQVMKSLPFRAITVGISFGVVRVRHPRKAAIEVEVATFRSDCAYVDGRRPTSVVYSSPELDAARRDFTINGMFMDPVSGQVIDHVGGLDDLHRQVLRAIGDPAERFREDKLRLLRAVRFAARFSIRIEPTTRAALE